jgi:hypothetical protein
MLAELFPADKRTESHDEADFRDFMKARKNSAFCPHSLFMCFVWFSQQTANISL